MAKMKKSNSSQILLHSFNLSSAAIHHSPLSSSSSSFPLLSALPPLSLPLHFSLSLSIFLFLSLPLSLLVYLFLFYLSLYLSLCPGARWWRRVCVGFQEHASGIIQPAHMKDSWCLGVCVYVCMCVTHTQALTGKREQGDTEKKRKEGRGDRGYRLWDKLTVRSRANSPGCDYTAGFFAHFQTPFWPCMS